MEADTLKKELPIM